MGKNEPSMSNLPALVRDVTGTNKKKLANAFNHLALLSSREHAANRAPMRQQGVVQALVQAATAKKRTVDTLQSCLTILNNLAVEPSNRAPMANDLGVAALLVGTIQDSLDNIEIHTISAAKCLVNLSIDAKTHLPMVASNVVAVLTSLSRCDDAQARQWAVWALTNLALTEACVPEFVKHNTFSALMALVGSGEKSAQGSGFMAFRNLSTHSAAAQPILEAGFVDSALGLLPHGDFAQLGNTREESSVFVVLRLAFLPDCKQALRDRGAEAVLKTVSAHNNFVGTAAYMALLLVASDKQEEGQEDLVAGAVALHRVVDITRATLAGEGLPNLYQFGMFSVDLVLASLCAMCNVEANRAPTAATGVAKDIVGLLPNLDPKSESMGRALATALLLVDEEGAKEYFLQDDTPTRTLQALVEGDSLSDANRATAASLLDKVEGLLGPKLLFFDCLGDRTRVVLCKAGRAADHPRPVSIALEDLMSLREAWELDQSAEYQGEVMEGEDTVVLKELVAKMVGLVEKHNPVRTVAGLTGWFRGAESSSRKGAMHILDKVKLELLKTHSTNRFQFFELSPSEQGVSEAKALDYAARTNNLGSPSLLIGSIDDTLQFVIAGKHFAMGAPVFAETVAVLKEKGTEGVARVEEMWEMALDQFRVRHPQFPMREMKGLAVAHFAKGARLAGLEAQLPIPAEKATNHLLKAMQRLVKSHEKAPALDDAECELLSLLLAQTAVYDALVHPKSLLTFAESFEVHGEPYAADWMTGWYIQALLQHVRERQVPDKARSIGSNEGDLPMVGSVKTGLGSVDGLAPLQPPQLDSRHASVKAAGRHFNDEATSLLCGVCMENRKKAVFHPCGHMACNPCAKLMLQARKPCHVCRDEVASIEKISPEQLKALKEAAAGGAADSAAS